MIKIFTSILNFEILYYNGILSHVRISGIYLLFYRFKTKVTSEKKAVDSEKVIGFKLVWTAVAFEFDGK